MTQAAQILEYLQAGKREGIGVLTRMSIAHEIEDLIGQQIGKIRHKRSKR